MYAFIQRLLKHEAGTASIEAAVMLPFFIICWSGIVYMYTGQDNALEQRTNARHCAWAYSNNGCRSVPTGCTASAPTTLGEDVPWADAPIIGDMLGSVLGESTTVTAEEEYGRPPMLGGGTSRALGRYTIMCNTTGRDFGDVVHDTMCAQLSSFPGC